MHSSSLRPGYVRVLVMPIVVLACGAPEEERGMVDTGVYWASETDCTDTCREVCRAGFYPGMYSTEFEISDLEGGHYAMRLSCFGTSGAMSYYDATCEVTSDMSFWCAADPEGEFTVNDGEEWTVDGHWLDRQSMTGSSVLVYRHIDDVCTMTSEFTAALATTLF